MSLKQATKRLTREDRTSRNLPRGEGSPADAEAVVSDIDGDGSAKAGHSGDEIGDDVVILAVYYPDAKAAEPLDSGFGSALKIVT